jgi:hypothetical protein
MRTLGHATKTNDSIRKKLAAEVSAQELLARPRVAKAEPS